ncbi:MAG: PHP domain-containing protein [Terriglobales bacterium]
MHTEWSDGSASIQEMAEAADARGYEYIAITDHSKGLKIAGGINEEQLRQQAEEIAAVNQSLGAAGKTLRVLRSIEVNLNPAGQVDMEVSSLGELDIVLGCFHSSLRKKDDQTDRYVAALRNPAIQILGHPRGRIYNFRHCYCRTYMTLKRQKNVESLPNHYLGFDAHFNGYDESTAYAAFFCGKRISTFV